MCNHRPNNALCYQPYTMALVKSKANFNGVEDKLHRTCRPFNNDKEFFTRDSSPVLPLPEQS